MSPASSVDLAPIVPVALAFNKADASPATVIVAELWDEEE